MPSFVEIGQPVPEEKIFEGFYQIWAWQPSWSCDLDYLYTHWLPIDASQKKKNHIKFGFDWPSGFRGDL